VLLAAIAAQTKASGHTNSGQLSPMREESPCQTKNPSGQITPVESRIDSGARLRYPRDANIHVAIRTIGNNSTPTSTNCWPTKSARNLAVQPEICPGRSSWNLNDAPSWIAFQ
jgi:hypothetical protein